MPNQSTIFLIGHLGRDAESKAVGSTNVVTFTVAYTRKRKDQETTTWFRCQWFGDRATKVVQYLTKGKAICVTGELYQREYEKDGAKRTSLEIDVRDVTLLGSGEKPASPSAEGRPYTRGDAPAPSGDDSPPPF
jgi:single-strand DNA-binding protein